MKTYKSAHQHGDEVVLNFFDAGTISNAKITEVAFKPNKVFYDAEIEIKDGMKTRIHGIDSAFVSKKTNDVVLKNENEIIDDYSPIFSIKEIEKILDHERINHGTDPLDSINRIYRKLLSSKDKNISNSLKEEVFDFIPSIRFLNDSNTLKQIFPNINIDFNVYVTNIPSMSFNEDTSMPIFFSPGEKIINKIAQTMMREHLNSFVSEKKLKSIIFIATKTEDLFKEKIRFYYFEKKETYFYVIKTNHLYDKYFVLNQTYDVKTVNRTLPQETVANFTTIHLDHKKIVFTTSKRIEVNTLYHIGDINNCLVTEFKDYSV